MKDKPKIQIQFPNLLLIVILSIIFSTMKAYDLIEWNWAMASVVVPVSLYLGWCICWLLMLLLGTYATIRISDLYNMNSEKKKNKTKNNE